MAEVFGSGPAGRESAALDVISMADPRDSRMNLHEVIGSPCIVGIWTARRARPLETTFHQDLNGDGVITEAPIILDLDGKG